MKGVMTPRIIITEKINFQILDLSFKISFINSSFGKIAQNGFRLGDVAEI